MKTYGEFFRDDTGAVTIDWVALTAGILLLGIMVVYAIFNGGVAGLVGSINDTLASVTTDVNLGNAMGCGAVENCGGPMELAGGGSLPVGSEVVFSDGFLTEFRTPDGVSIVTLSEGNFDGDFSNVLPEGTKVGSNNTFTLSDGSSVSASDFMDNSSVYKTYVEPV